MNFIIRDERTPALTARGLMRRHLRGGMIVEVPIDDVEEHPDAIRWAEERATRDAAHSPGARAIVSLCGCWHRSDGGHTADCAAAGYEPQDADRAGTWRRVPDVIKELAGTDPSGKKIWHDVPTTRLVPPREVVDVTQVAPTSAPTVTAEPDLVAVLDTETTGLRPEGRIVEIGVAVVDLVTGSIPARASQLVNPGVPIPAAATAVHGITDADVSTARTLAEVWPRVVAFVARHCPSLIVVAHNAAFDRGVLSDDLARCGVLSLDWPRWRWFCSVTLAKRQWPTFPTHSLHDNAKGAGLRTRLGLPKQTSHRAMGDVLTTCGVLARIRAERGAPLDPWAGPAHVWGVGVEKAEKVERTPTPAPAKRPRTVKARSPGQSGQIESAPDLFSLKPGVSA